MKILYAGMKYDYGKPEQGYSFEHFNFYDSLVNMGHDILYFDFMTLVQKHGKAYMNKRLLEIVKAEKPDLLYAILFTDEFDQDVLKEISSSTDTKTINWFCDDHWRFDNYSKHWAPCFNYVVTTARSAVPKYAGMGYANAIKSQWGCNPFLYRKLGLPLAYDITFVGQPHGNRREIVGKIRDSGADIKVWGSGWETGRISQDEMIRVFNQSRINLNLNNSSVTMPPPPEHGPALKFASRVLGRVPMGQRIKDMVGPRVAGMKKPVKTAADGASAPKGQYVEQIKGRNFEVPGCSGFMLTGNADDLGTYYSIGKEIVCFENPDDMIEKIGYYLKHEDERAAIAQAGYDRTMREHTYVHRFAEIFRRAGLQCESPEAILGGQVKPGKTLEVG